jgi:transcription initiation factor TFIIH subunit 1
MTHSNTAFVDLFASKEGSAQVKLKVVQTGDETGYMFTFTSPQALVEREKFKTELTTYMGGNRTNSDSAANKALKNSKSPISVQPQLPRPVLAVASPSVAAGISRSQSTRALSIPGDKRAATPVIIGNDPVADFRMRKTVLMSNPELLTLHRELVMTGQITEAEFWEGREVRFLFHVSLTDTKLAHIGY